MITKPRTSGTLSQTFGKLASSECWFRNEVCCQYSPASRKISYLLVVDSWVICLVHGKALSKLLNRQTVKISYCCTKNIRTTIQNHNAKVLNSVEPRPQLKRCSCREKDKCPLQNDCADRKDVIYHAQIEEGEKKQYIGSTQEFKKRYYAHKESFRNEASKNKTTLATHIWEKKLNPEPKITWSILADAPSYRLGSRHCDLCLTEKVFILENIGNPSYLNRRSELAQKCRHRAKYLLMHTKG